MANPVNDDPADPAPATEPGAVPTSVFPANPYAWLAHSMALPSQMPPTMGEHEIPFPVQHVFTTSMMPASASMPQPVTMPMHTFPVAHIFTEGPAFPLVSRPQVLPKNKTKQPKTAAAPTTEPNTLPLNDGPATTRPKNHKKKPTETSAAETVTMPSLNDQPEVPQLKNKKKQSTATATMTSSSASASNPEGLLKNKVKQLETAMASVDLETVLENVKKVDNTCSFSKCKRRTADFAIDCKYCSGRFCTTHGLPEIHGCGESVRRDARRNFLHPEPHVSKDKHDKAQTKLNIKLRQMEQERKGKSPSKDKKK